MKALKIVLLIMFIFFFACSNPKDTTVKEKQTFTINMVSHGQASDPFWSTVKNGAEAAAKKLGVKLIYQAPTNFDMVTMAQMIDAVTATAPHGLIVSVPDIAALKKSIGNAIDKNIPVIAICDTNTNPSNVDYPIPGNDDALRAISLYCDLVAASVLKGLETNLEESGVDIGETKDLAEEKIIDDVSNEVNVHS